MTDITRQEILTIGPFKKKSADLCFTPRPYEDILKKCGWWGCKEYQLIFIPPETFPVRKEI